MTEHRETYIASPCPCGHKTCVDWHVWPVAARQGVSFSEEQARAVAKLLNETEVENDRSLLVLLSDEEFRQRYNVIMREKMRRWRKAKVNG